MSGTVRMSLVEMEDGGSFNQGGFGGSGGGEVVCGGDLGLGKLFVFIECLDLSGNFT